MIAVILAGGKGTRLGELTAEIPKPMVPVVDEPIVERQIKLLREYGITEVILITNHLSQILEDYLGNGSKWNVNISYFIEPKPLGTVGGIKAIEDQLTEDFLVVYGDVMLDMDFGRLIDFHHRKNSEATIVVHPNDHPYDSDLVEMDNQDKIIAFHSKPHPDNFVYTNMVNAGVYLFSPKVLAFLEADKKADFGKHIFPAIYDKLAMYGYNTPEYIKDMGTLDRLEKVSKDLESGKINRLNLKNKRAAIFLDRDGVLNKKNGYIYRQDQFELFDKIPATIKKINQSEYLSIMVTNQPVIARGMCTEEELRGIHKKMETILGDQRAKLDGIYYCPHHPDKGFEGEVEALKIDCACRKPKPGMLHDAADFFNIDLGASYIIGDSWRDIQAGKSAGVTTIGVMTGDGNKSGKVKPDYLFQDTTEAVNFILQDPLFPVFEKVLTAFESRKRTDQPYIIAIGGNTRSGKSTLSKYLEKSFQKKNKTSLTIPLDHWIKTNLERNYEDDVFDRFRVDVINSDLSALINRGEITLDKPYQRHKNHSIQPISFQLNQQEVLIVEGVVALGIDALKDADLKIYVETDSELHQHRLHNYYVWKEYNEDIISDIYHKRKIDEFEKIELTKKGAHMIVPALKL